MSYNSLLLIKRKWMGNIVFLKSTHPSFSPIKEGSTSTPFSSSEGGNTTGLRCSELLSSKKMKGPSGLCQIVRDGTSEGDDNLKSTNYDLQLIANCKP